MNRFIQQVDDATNELSNLSELSRIYAEAGSDPRSDIMKAYPETEIIYQQFDQVLDQLTAGLSTKLSSEETASAFSSLYQTPQILESQLSLAIDRYLFSYPNTAFATDDWPEQLREAYGNSGYDKTKFVDTDQLVTSVRRALTSFAENAQKYTAEDLKHLNKVIADPKLTEKILGSDSTVGSVLPHVSIKDVIKQAALSPASELLFKHKKEQGQFSNDVMDDGLYGYTKTSAKAGIEALSEAVQAILDKPITQEAVDNALNNVVSAPKSVSSSAMSQEQKSLHNLVKSIGLLKVFKQDVNQLEVTLGTQSHLNNAHEVIDSKIDQVIDGLSKQVTSPDMANELAGIDTESLAFKQQIMQTLQDYIAGSSGERTGKLLSAKRDVEQCVNDCRRNPDNYSKSAKNLSSDIESTLELSKLPNLLDVVKSYKQTQGLGLETPGQSDTPKSLGGGASFNQLDVKPKSQTSQTNQENTQTPTKQEGRGR